MTGPNLKMLLGKIKVNIFEKMRTNIQYIKNILFRNQFGQFSKSNCWYDDGVPTEY